ncbi:MAG: GFA family protein [Verrucomicrobia bacterium]|nr:GFA family protein [Verrucomicrobiota bacterium]
MKGSCHCGAVRYESAGKILRFVNCHCDDCRKISAAACSPVVAVTSKGFAVTQGEDRLVAYESSPGKFRNFCGNCGSHLFARVAAQPKLILIRAGTLDDDPGIKPQAHIWVSAKVAWHDICDDLPQYAEWLPQ